MSIPAKRKSYNHMVSVNKFVEGNFADPNNITVNYQDETFDASSYDQWVDVNFLSFGAGRKSEMLVQFDIYSRIRGKNSDGDEYGAILNDYADKLHEAMHVDGIQIYDFAIPASPVALNGSKLMVQNSGGTFREPESDQILDIEDGTMRRSITYRLRMVEDASNAFSYYD